MDWPNTISTLWQASDASTKQVSWVSPIFSVMAAALQLRVPRLAENLTFVGDCESYARNNGLLDVLEGRYSFPDRSGLHGVTYSKLTRLSSEAEVDACNSIVGDLIHQQLGNVNETAANQIARVVGELHDNIASHADGMGYSSAQTYSTNGQPRLVFAIADSGRGMLANVQRVDPTFNSHLAAIRWCMSKGNTTARNSGSWAQRLPDDCCVSPYPTSVETTISDNHHMGIGLHKLCQLVSDFGGRLWVLSGDSHIFSRNRNETSGRSRLEWNGVAIEFEIPIPQSDTLTPPLSPELEELGRRIGI